MKLLIAYMETEIAIQKMLCCSHAMMLGLVLVTKKLLRLTSNFLQIQEVASWSQIPNFPNHTSSQLSPLKITTFNDGCIFLRDFSHRQHAHKTTGAGEASIRLLFPTYTKYRIF